MTPTSETFIIELMKLLAEHDVDITEGEGCLYLSFADIDITFNKIENESVFFQEIAPAFYERFGIHLSEYYDL